WLALGTTLAAVLAYARNYAPAWQPHAWSAAVLAMGVLSARTLANWDDGNWLAYHTLMLTWTLAAWGIHGWSTGISRSRPAKAGAPNQESFNAWVQLAGALVVALAVRSAWHDPARFSYVPSFA